MVQRLRTAEGGPARAPVVEREQRSEASDGSRDEPARCVEMPISARQIGHGGQRLAHGARHLGEVWVLQREANEEQMLGHEHRLHDARERAPPLAIVRHLRARQHDVLRLAQVAVTAQSTQTAAVKQSTRTGASAACTGSQL
eukprot:2855428-Pleurochrysis_carterae.AAC.2